MEPTDHQLHFVDCQTLLVKPQIMIGLRRFIHLLMFAKCVQEGKKAFRRAQLTGWSCSSAQTLIAAQLFDLSYSL